MEKLEQDTAIVYRHETTYKGENICAKIIKIKSSDYIRVQVSTPVRDDFATRARFHKSEDEIKLMSDAKRIARTYITEATTDIDKHLTEEENIEGFFESVDEQVESLEGKAKVIEQKFNQELEKI